MKKRLILLTCGVVLALTGCGPEKKNATGLEKEPIPVAESGQQAAQGENAPAEQTEQTEGNATEAVITKEQALEAVKNYCIANNPDLEAIIFANDTMTIGGYTAIMKRGLKIGKDILVAGFDNTPTASSHSPALTTVDNKIMELGYSSIYQAIELVQTGKTSTSSLPSSMVVRIS